MGYDQKQRVLATLLCMASILGLIALVLTVVDVTNLRLSAVTKYGMVFDAGSSHTSLFVYQWLADKENGTGVVSQALDCRVNGSGISSYASNPAQAGESLQHCLQEALVLIPEVQHKETPLFLGATAGMRLLNQKNSSQANSIFEAVSRTLGQSPADFRGAEILTGETEGADGWITVNYALRSLVQYSFSGEWIQPPEMTLVGALDMGGASTQITFIPKGPILDKSTEATFRLYGFNYSLYTHSYLCYGRDQVLNRLLVGLVQKSTAGSPIRHPCYLSGYSTVVSLTSLYDSACISTETPPDLPQNLTVEGTGNPEACIAIVRDLFNFSSCLNPENCSFDGVYQPPVHGQFYAFANFFYTFDFLNLTAKQPLPIVNDTIWKFCQTPWDQVEGNYPEQKAWLPDYCASGLYIFTLLTEGYGFTQDTWANIEFHSKVSDTDIGWTLGYMLNLTNLIPAQAPAYGRVQAWSLSMAGAVFVVLTFVFILGAAAVKLFWPQRLSQAAF